MVAVSLFGRDIMKLSRVTASVLALVMSSSAFSTVFKANMTGSQENPPNASTATGFATIDVTGNLLTITMTFSGLTAPSSAAHIHCCSSVTANAPVAIDFVGLGFPTGVTSGSYTHVFDLSDINTYSTGFRNANGVTIASVQAAFMTGINSTRAYTNIHNATFPAGEIRGQIPEPAALGLLGLGLVGLGIARRRKV
jgi:CHRD domain/PEP-CTERM motif